MDAMFPKWQILLFLLISTFFAPGPTLAGEEANVKRLSPNPERTGEIAFQCEAIPEEKPREFTPGISMYSPAEPCSFLVSTDSVFLLDSRARKVSCFALPDQTLKYAIELDPALAEKNVMFTDLALSPDGQLLVAASRQGVVHVCQDGKVLRKVPLGQHVRLINRLSTDGTGLFMADDPEKGVHGVFDFQGNLIAAVPWDFQSVLLPGRQVVKTEVASSPRSFNVTARIFQLSDLSKPSSTISFPIENRPLVLETLGQTGNGDLVIYAVCGKAGDDPEDGFALRVGPTGEIRARTPLPFRDLMATLRVSAVRPDPTAPGGFSIFFSSVVDGKFQIRKFRIL